MRSRPRILIVDDHSSIREPLSMYLQRFDFDVERRELRNPDQQAIALSTAEYHLLLAFLENPNRVLSRMQLLDLTQRSEKVSFDRSIDSQVSRLRKKLERDARHPSLLKTVRGDGYGAQSGFESWR